MVNWRDLQVARREGSLAAQRTRRRLGLPLERRVDVMALIEAEGIWLMFQPLRDLFGFYRRSGGSAGIVINSNHPASLQRYTAAHELGHHILGHGFSLDEDHYVDGAIGLDEAREFDEALSARSIAELGDPLEEAAAQAFAGTFLMPIQVVNHTLIAHGYDRDHPKLDPSGIYTLSLEFGTSYHATVTQLAALEKLTWMQARQLRVAPINIKTLLTGGRGPLDARADVWMVHCEQTKRDLPLRVNDEVVLRLPEVPSSGYAWELRRRSFAALDLLEDVVEAVDDDDDRYGGEAVRIVHLRANSPGVDEVVIELRRPWEDAVLQQVVLAIHAVGEPTGDAPYGLVRSQQVQRALVA